VVLRSQDAQALFCVQVAAPHALFRQSSLYEYVQGPLHDCALFAGGASAVASHAG
jgi:hypothetical protein